MLVGVHHVGWQSHQPFPIKHTTARTVLGLWRGRQDGVVTGAGGAGLQARKLRQDFAVRRAGQAHGGPDAQAQAQRRGQRKGAQPLSGQTLDGEGICRTAKSAGFQAA